MEPIATLVYCRAALGVPMIECKTTNFTNPSSTQYQNIWNYIHSVFLWPIIHLQTGNRFPVRELTTCSPIKRFCFTHTGALDIRGTPRLCNTRLRRICTSRRPRVSRGRIDPIIFQHLGLELFELCGKQKFVWKWMLMHIIYYIKYKHFITAYVCNFCLLRESILLFNKT